MIPRATGLSTSTRRPTPTTTPRVTASALTSTRRSTPTTTSSRRELTHRGEGSPDDLLAESRKLRGQLEYSEALATARAAVTAHQATAAQGLSSRRASCCAGSSRKTWAILMLRRPLTSRGRRRASATPGLSWRPGSRSGQVGVRSAGPGGDGGGRRRLGRGAGNRRDPSARRTRARGGRGRAEPAANRARCPRGGRAARTTGRRDGGSRTVKRGARGNPDQGAECPWHGAPRQRPLRRGPLGAAECPRVGPGHVRPGVTGSRGRAERPRSL